MSTLEAIVEELFPALSGAVVQQVYGPTPHDVYLEVRRPGVSTLVHIAARQGRVHLGVASHKPPMPQNPQALQQRLRKHLTGAQLWQLRCSVDSLTMTFAGGRGGGVLSAQRRPETSLVFVPKSAASAKTAEGYARNESAGARGNGTALGEAARPRRVEVGAPSIRDTPEDDFPIARRAEAELATAGRETEEHAVDRERREARKRFERTYAKVQADLQRCGQADAHRRYGEILKRNLHKIPRGATFVELQEYDDSGHLTRSRVPLRPQLAPDAQAAWHFNQYRRMSRGLLKAQERLKQLDAERALLLLPPEASSLVGNEVGVVGGAGSAPRPDALSRPVGGLPYREFKSSSGQAIWVGRGAKENDALTLRYSQPHHVWLHARSVSGAHVVIPLQKGEKAGAALLEEAAHLAAHFSRARGEHRVDVSHTLARYVRKAPKSPPGSVTLSREEVLSLRVRPELIERLLQNRAGEPSV